MTRNIFNTSGGMYAVVSKMIINGMHRSFYLANDRHDPAFQYNQALKTLAAELEAICGKPQTDAIIEAIMFANSYQGGRVDNCLTIMAVGETLQYTRTQARQALADYRSALIDSNIIPMSAAEVKARLDQKIMTYKIVMQAYYTLYHRFMGQYQR